MEKIENIELPDKYKNFVEKFNEYIEKKYKPNDSISKSLSYVTPAILSFIGAYSILVECITNIIISLSNELPIVKHLLQKLFLFYISIFELYFGVKYFIFNLTDHTTINMIKSSKNDLDSKIERCGKQLGILIFSKCDDIIEEKMNEFSEVD